MQALDTHETVRPRRGAIPPERYRSERPAYDVPISNRAMSSHFQYHHRERYEQTAMMMEPTPWEITREQMPVRGHGVSKSNYSRSMLEYDESSPSTTPKRLPTIDAPCNVNTKRMDTTARDTTRRRSAVTTNQHQLMEGGFAETFTPRQPCTSFSVKLDKDDHEPVDVPAKKRQRYLRDVDRRSIIRRIDNGEKQAGLAREFGVTRAAICHIKKNRDEIVSRYESLLASAKEMEALGMSVSPAEKELMPSPVQELTQQSVLLLLTALRDVKTPHCTFRASANRLMVLLIEEALASVVTITYNFQTSNGETIRGVKSTSRLCCVSVGHKGLPLVRQYRQIESRGLVGCIHLAWDHQSNVPVANRVDLPREMTADACVLLTTSSTATGQSVCAAIHALIEVGVEEENIRVVTLACTTDAVKRIRHQFSGVRILTCAVEGATRTNTASSTTLSDFSERYQGLTKPNHPVRAPHAPTVKSSSSSSQCISARWEDMEAMNRSSHHQQIRDPRCKNLQRFSP